MIWSTECERYLAHDCSDPHHARRQARHPVIWLGFADRNLERSHRIGLGGTRFQTPSEYPQDHAREVLVRSVEVCVTRARKHTSELQSLRHLVCRLLLEKKKQI